MKEVCWRDKTRVCDHTCTAHNVGDKVKISFDGDKPPSGCLIIQVLLAKDLSAQQLEVIFEVLF